MRNAFRDYDVIEILFRCWNYQRKRMAFKINWYWLIISFVECLIVITLIIGVLSVILSLFPGLLFQFA